MSNVNLILVSFDFDFVGSHFGTVLFLGRWEQMGTCFYVERL